MLDSDDNSSSEEDNNDSQEIEGSQALDVSTHVDIGSEWGVRYCDTIRPIAVLDTGISTHNGGELRAPLKHLNTNVLWLFEKF